jgi:hypothetical protein
LWGLLFFIFLVMLTFGNKERGFVMTNNGQKDLIRGPWSWTKDDIKLLKRLYPRGNTRMIAERLCRPLTAVRQKAYDMGMKTDVYQYWTDDDLKLLTRLYPNTMINELAKRFGRSPGSIKTKARQLGLKKSQSFLKAIKSRPRKRHK